MNPNSDNLKREKIMRNHSHCHKWQANRHKTELLKTELNKNSLPITGK
jgi:hypothetical protein